jgi:hypothetical protein
MAQSIALAEKFQPILDEVYRKETITSILDAQTKPVDFAGANVVKIFKTDPIGLGTYSRTTGYPKGQMVGSWETLTLATERGREFNIDRMDDEESLGMAFGTLVGEFMRTEVGPELDAYRFAAYAGWSSIDTTAGATLTSSTVLAAFDAAMLSMDNNQVPSEGRIMFVSSAVARMFNAAVTRILSNEGMADRRLQALDSVRIIPVPQGRFYTVCTLNAGAAVDAGGYATGGVGINFMLLHPSAVLQVQKHANLKIFTPDENQDMDTYKIQYRLYHDAFVFENKVKGVYLHKLGGA